MKLINQTNQIKNSSNTLAIAIQTARKGSKSVRLKNEILVEGVPLFLHNLISAKNSNKIDATFMSTDIEKAYDYADKFGFSIIPRDISLAGDDASHYETIKSALLAAESSLKKTVDILVVLLGNNRCAASNDLNSAVEMLEENTGLDSVISVGKYNMFNPLRAFKKNNKNRLNNCIDNLNKDLSGSSSLNDKNSMGDIFFFNGSFWAIRREVFFRNNGLKPFTWLGNEIGYIEQDPRCMEIDDSWQVQVVKSYGN